MLQRKNQETADFISRISRAYPALAALAHSSLLKNGYALVASAGLTSVLGLVFWGLASRFYSPEQVGLGAALISTMLALGNISQLNMGNFLNRYLPASEKDSAVRLVLWAYALAVAAAAFLSTLAIIFISSVTPELSFLREQPVSAAAFVVATIAWTLFALQDSVLAGLRRATVVPIENAVFAVAKLLLLALFAGSSILGAGLYAAWILPLPLLLAGINWLIFIRFLPRHRTSGDAQKPDRQALTRYFGWDYLGTLASMTAMGIAPLIVLHYGGSANLAVYYISWEIVYGVYLISRSMGVSLLAEIAFDKTKLHRLAVDALIYTVAPLAGVVFVLLIAAPLLLSVLGMNASGTNSTLLRLFAISCLPWSVVTLILAVARATGRTQVVALAQVVTLAVVLGIGTPLVVVHGAVGMAAAWFIAHSITAVGLLTDLSRRLGPSGRIDLTLRLLSSLARIWSNIAPRRHSSPPLDASIASFCAATGLEAPDPQTVREFYRESDVRTGMFRTAGPPAELLVFKASTSPEGHRAVTRHIKSSQELAANAALGQLDFAVSTIVASSIDASGARLAERALPGEDGRSIFAKSEQYLAALTQAVDAIHTMHSRTATKRVINEGWLDGWLHFGSDTVCASHSPLLGEPGRAEALAVFQAQQSHFWNGRSLPLGLGHGDFAPGNLLYTIGPDETDVRLSAIIDWETATEDTPPGLDAMFLLLTARAARSGEDLGFVIRRLLEAPLLTPEEMTAMEPMRATLEESYGALSDPAVLRALCGFAWWHHIATNLTKSSCFADKALWLAVNIDLVLAWYGGKVSVAPHTLAVGCLRRQKGSASATSPHPVPVGSTRKA
ncbi:phosphotransferase (plasmid) [Ensifer adhaerens]|uniref:phosphotransferase n=1 Tax=Ensifer adhaerens TaxID=106592 RepID=UPI0023A97C9C|nr:phosphotransferase [Ensifer adhaerens]WDZ80772.1 phosphotransferase [Ensifer adhaerens]